MHMLVKLSRCQVLSKKVHLRNSQPTHYYECTVQKSASFVSGKNPFPSGHYKHSSYAHLLIIANALLTTNTVYQFNY